TFFWQGSPVLPLYRRTFPEQRRPSGRFGSTFILIGESGFCRVHSISASSTSLSLAPSKTGVAIGVAPFLSPFLVPPKAARSVGRASAALPSALPASAKTP